MLAHEIEFDSEFQEKIYDALAFNGALKRSEICRLFGFKTYIYTNYVYNTKKAKESRIPNLIETKLHKKRTTVFDNLDKLFERGLVEKFTKNNGTRGRPPVFWKIKDGESNG